jgi:hypothetical protein
MTRSIAPSAATAATAHTFTACPMTTTRPSPGDDVPESSAAAAAGPGGRRCTRTPPRHGLGRNEEQPDEARVPRVPQRPEEVLNAPRVTESSSDLAGGGGPPGGRPTTPPRKDLLTTMPEPEPEPEPGSSGSAKTTVRRTWVGVASSSRAYTDARCPSAADWMVDSTDSQDDDGDDGDDDDDDDDALSSSGPPPPLRLRPLHGQVETEGGDGERLAALPGGRRDAGRSGEDGEDREDGGEAREEDPFTLIAAGIESLP